MTKMMHLEDILYTQGFGTRRVCAGLIEKGTDRDLFKE
jgi:hypothetical protein